MSMRMTERDHRRPGCACSDASASRNGESDSPPTPSDSSRSARPVRSASVLSSIA